MSLTAELAAVVSQLPAEDQSFANSLISSARRYGSPSVKQAHWMGVLIDRATKPTAAPVTRTEKVGDLAGVVALFQKAQRHLKRPAVVLGYDADRELRISLAGSAARVPGSLNVVDQDSRTWFGRIHPDGTFEHSRRDPPPAGLGAILARFAADPATAAAEHGRLTGKCCFCNSTLTDERSTGVGYGPVCADHFGLAWGKRAADARQAELACV